MSTPGAAQEHQEHPGTPRSTQEHPRSTQEHPRSTQEHAGARRSTQEHPRSTQEHPGAPRSTQVQRHQRWFLGIYENRKQRQNLRVRTLSSTPKTCPWKPRPHPAKASKFENLGTENVSLKISRGSILATLNVGALAGPPNLA